MVSRWRHSFHTKTLSGLIRWLRLRTRTSFGCLVHCVAHDIRAPPHTRIVLGRLVCNHLKTHASSCTCIVITGAPLHSGTAARSRVCAVPSRWRPPLQKPLSNSLQSLGSEQRNGFHRRPPTDSINFPSDGPRERAEERVPLWPPTNCINSPGCGLSSFREAVHLTIGSPARIRELRLRVRTLRTPCALQAADSAAACLYRPTASPRASGPRLSRPTAPCGSRFLGNCE